MLLQYQAGRREDSFLRFIQPIFTGIGSINIHYPERAMDRRTKGKVKIMFSVDEKGKTGEYIVTQSAAYILDEEVIRLY